LPVIVAHAAIGWGDTRRESGKVDEGLVRLLREALEMVDPGPNRLVARLKARLAAALYFRGPAGRAQAEELSREALLIARRRGDPLTLVATLLSRHFVRWGSARPEEELSLVEEILAVLGDPPVLVDAAQEARLWQISDCLELGKANDVRRAISAYAATAELSKTPLHRSWVARHRALDALVTGRFDDALRSSEESARLGRAAQDPNAGPFHAAYRAEIAMLRGDKNELARLHAEITAVAEASPLVAWRATSARVASQLGDHRKAAQNLSSLVDECLGELDGDHTRFAAFAALADVAVALRDAARGERLYRELLAHLDRFVVSGSGALYHGPAAFPAGRLALLLGKTDDARAHFERSLELSRGLEARPFVALSTDALGRAVADKSRAARLRKEAEALAAELPIALG
jgi:tetratricopeptide (TPR) repeat protein